MALIQTDATATLTASAISVYVIQKLKNSGWFKLLTPDSKYMNIFASIVAAGVSATGINYTFNESTGTLTITGLTLTGILTMLWIWAKSFVINEVLYQGTVGAPSRAANAAQTAVQQTLAGVMQKVGVTGSAAPPSAGTGIGGQAKT